MAVVFCHMQKLYLKSCYLNIFSMIDGIDAFCPGTFRKQADNVLPTKTCPLKQLYNNSAV